MVWERRLVRQSGDSKIVFILIIFNTAPKESRTVFCQCSIIDGGLCGCGRHEGLHVNPTNSLDLPPTDLCAFSVCLCVRNYALSLFIF